MNKHYLIWCWDDQKMNNTSFKLGSSVKLESNELVKVNDHTFKLFNNEFLRIIHNEKFEIIELCYYEAIPEIDGIKFKNLNEKNVVSFLDKRLARYSKKEGGDYLLVIFSHSLLRSSYVIKN